MGALTILIMIAAGIVMIVGLMKQRQGVEWGRPVAIVAALVALICALGSIFTKDEGAGRSVVKREQKYQFIGGKKLGEYLAQNYAGSKALIVKGASVSSSMPDPSKHIVEGLREGLGDQITVVAEATPPQPTGAGAPPEGAPGPPMMFITAAAFDKMFQQYAGQVDMVITTVGLPMDKERMKLWQMKKGERPKVVIASGGLRGLLTLISRGGIVAALAVNPAGMVVGDTDIPSDEQAAFDKRFLLVTPQNVASMQSHLGAAMR